MSETHQCTGCGRMIETATSCPFCGTPQGDLGDELARIERSIAEMKARELAIGDEQRQIAQQLQAAQFQRDILAHANDDRRRQGGRGRRFRRGGNRRPAPPSPPPAGPPPSAAAPPPPGAGRPGAAAPPSGSRPGPGPSGPGPSSARPGPATPAGSAAPGSAAGPSAGSRSRTAPPPTAPPTTEPSTTGPSTTGPPPDAAAARSRSGAAGMTTPPSAAAPPPGSGYSAGTAARPAPPPGSGYPAGTAARPAPPPGSGYPSGTADRPAPPPSTSAGAGPAPGTPSPPPPTSAGSGPAPGTPPPPGAPRVPRQEGRAGARRHAPAADAAGQAPPRDDWQGLPDPFEPPASGEGAPPHPPEASSREVQNIYLALGGLLLGIAAAVVALTSYSNFSRVAILAAASGALLAGAPLAARRGLTSTAETLAAVGLLLVPLTGYAVWTVDSVATSGVPGGLYAGLTFAVTAVVAALYGGATGLALPRYGLVLAVQPVLPLLARDAITGPAGWALALAAVAALDLWLARLFTADGRLTAAPWLSRRAGPPPEPADDPAGADPAGPGPADRAAGAYRPESAGEEVDAVVTAAADGRRIPARERRPAAPGPATPWLRELTFALHAVAAVLALGYAVLALVAADTVPAAARAGSVLLLAAVVGLAGALALDRPPVRDVAAGVLTLAVIAAVGKVSAEALPGRSLVLVAAAVALTGVAVRALPEQVRRGPQLASALALLVIGAFVAGTTVRAAVAPVRIAMPPWRADLSGYPERLAGAVGPAGWQLAAAAFLLTVAAVVALPIQLRREFAVTGAAATALAMPASLALPWPASPWPAAVAGIGIAAAGLSAETVRAARAHALAALAAGLGAAGAAMARPGSTAAVLGALAAAGILIALAPASRTIVLGRTAGIVADWASGGAALAIPGAVAGFVASAIPLGAAPAPDAVARASLTVLAASFLAACGTLSFAALRQVAHRELSAPLAVGTALGALAVAIAAFGAPGATPADALVGGALLVAAVLLVLAPSIDAGRRADRVLDGPDLATAAATAASVGALARIAAILAPGSALAAGAALVLLVAVAARAMPAHWRRGPVLGLAVTGAVIAAIAGYAAVVGGVRVLATPGRIWAADLDRWSAGAPGGLGWQAPVALALLAGAAAILLPRPRGYDVAAVLAGLATIGTPAALGLPWWSPIVVSGVVTVAYAVAAVAAADPRAGLAWAALAGCVALHAVGAALVRPWTTAAALGVLCLLGVVVAGLARAIAGMTAGSDGGAPSPAPPAMPVQLAQIGGMATGGALLAAPGALAALAAELGWPSEVVLTAALGGSSLGVAVVAVARRRIPEYLPYATVGIAGGATVTAAASIFAGLPFGVFAAATALLGVLAELLRAATPPPGATPAPGTAAAPGSRWSVLAGGVRRPLADPPRSRWAVSPTVGALLVSVVPAALAVAAVAPALVTALLGPYRVLGRVWAGPPPSLLVPPPAAVDPTNVLAALLLTIATALGATGFFGGRPARAVPVVLPGAAITLLIAPTSLGLGWPNATMAALAVFTIAMLGLALTPPPPPAEQARSLRVTRMTAFGIGLAAGGAGLAGALATRQLTLFTLGSAVGVGAVAALFGRTERARILGWLFGSVMAQLFVLTLGLVAGLSPTWSAFGVLAVGTLLLVGARTLPRLRRPEAVREAATVEWTGYGSALIALALAFQSPRHIAALLAAWGAVIGVAASRPGRSTMERRALFWSAVACEISAWWLLMWISDVGLVEAYTLPFAALALLVGILELRQHPQLSSWAAYGPALVAAFLPTLAIVLISDTSNVRQVALLLGAVAVLIVGSTSRQ
ncbi:SCO7613 C-terminal domain-containing membrane protein, partial [Plantactinospora siamensis]